MRSTKVALAVAAALALAPRLAVAQELLEPSQQPPEVRTDTKAGFSVAGYLEAYYQWNFGTPANRITNARAFDGRHDTFTLQNAVLDTSFTRGDVTGRIALQVGHVGAQAYASEPSSPGTSSIDGSDATLWRHVQQAFLGWTIPGSGSTLVEAGIFLSPIGPESVAVKDQWNWSRSDVFLALPYYHAGARVTRPLGDEVTASVMVCNGWNEVVDANDEKSFSAQLVYKLPSLLTVSVLYFGGVERANDAPERFGGPGSRGPFRHLFDGWVQLDATDALSFVLHGDGGFEINRFGTSSWFGGAAYARAKVASWLYVAARGDRLSEKLAGGAAGVASPIVLPAPVGWVASGTLTLDARPADGLSIRLEGRRDVAGGDLYFHGAIQGDGSAAYPYVPNASTQTTLTLGAVAWF